MFGWVVSLKKEKDGAAKPMKRWEPRSRSFTCVPAYAPLIRPRRHKTDMSSYATISQSDTLQNQIDKTRDFYKSQVEHLHRELAEILGSRRSVKVR